MKIKTCSKCGHEADAHQPYCIILVGDGIECGCCFIKKGDMVEINRDRISNVLASYLPRDLFYNDVEVVNVDRKDERVEVKFGENTYWFDFDELKN